MPSVLFVDDDASFLASLGDAVANEPYEATFARDGVEALESIHRRAPDLVVTDVNMPRMDGLQLLAQILHHGGFVPCLVMTAFGTPSLERHAARCGGLEFIHKPVDVPQLKQRIRQMVSERKSTSIVRGIALASFLQLLAMEMKSCTVKVTKGPHAGLLFFRDGRLVHAATGDQEGPGAFRQLLSWDPVELGIHDGCTTPQTTISEGLDSLLLDALRHMDETSRGEVRAQPPPTRKGDVMALESYLEEFKSIKGYISAGIMDYTGEILASHTASDRVDLVSTGAIFNDIFRSAHEASRKIGLDACRNMAIATPKGIVVMECSGAEKQPHVHMLVVLEESGNQALAKVNIAKVLPKIVAELS